ncbi:MAG: 3-methyladenine glycosylase, partial [Nocardioidaceae bacterium]|nr:3-methyladenine glycosylase [Nocardioidaceae bacterium]
DQHLFERMTLEAFQSGLSWLIIFRKRDRFREVFADFDAKVVAEFGPAEVETLMADAGIVRNRAKILATIKNAQAIAELDVPLSDLLWGFAPTNHVRPAALSDMRATTPESVALAKELKKSGFAFVGPTTAYALMQATGMVNDHLVGCEASAAAEDRPLLGQEGLDGDEVVS